MSSKAAQVVADDQNTVANADSNQQDDLVTIDRRRGERREGDPDATDVGAMKTPRRKKQRRRHIDPTTCERDYSGDEIEFMRAMDDYKRSAGRMFPTCSEVLEVIRALGYVKLDEEEMEILGIGVAAESSDLDAEFAAEDAELEESLEA
jgi:hypothetical protein